MLSQHGGIELEDLIGGPLPFRGEEGEGTGQQSECEFHPLEYPDFEKFRKRNGQKMEKARELNIRPD